MKIYCKCLKCGELVVPGRVICPCGNFTTEFLGYPFSQMKFIETLSHEAIASLLENFLKLTTKNFDSSGSKKVILKSNGKIFKIKLKYKHVIFLNPRCARCDRVIDKWLLWGWYSKSTYGRVTPVSADGFFFNVDHRKAQSLGGTNELKNYQTMCWICNNEKSKEEYLEYINTQLQEGNHENRFVERQCPAGS